MAFNNVNWTETERCARALLGAPFDSQGGMPVVRDAVCCRVRKGTSPDGVYSTVDLRSSRDDEVKRESLLSRFEVF